MYLGGEVTNLKTDEVECPRLLNVKSLVTSTERRFFYTLKVTRLLRSYISFAASCFFSFFFLVEIIFLLCILIGKYWN